MSLMVEFERKNTVAKHLRTLKTEMMSYIPQKYKRISCSLIIITRAYPVNQFFQMQSDFDEIWHTEPV